MKKIQELSQNWKLIEQESGQAMEIPHMPMQVHEILHYHKKIDHKFQWGKTEGCKWVNEKTWIYETEFYNEEDGKAVLSFPGLDTFCSVWLNGVKIGESRDSYLPCEIAVGEVLRKGKNQLQVIFEPVQKELERIKKKYSRLLEDTALKPAAFIRKTFHDFTTYLGNDDDFYKVGIYRPVRLLIYPEYMGIHHLEIAYSLNETLEKAKLQITPELWGKMAGEEIRVAVTIRFQEKIVWQQEQGGEASFYACLENVELWWPRGYGEQPLYEVQAKLMRNGVTADEAQVFIGFRKIEMRGMLDFTVNQVPVKLWGANLTPDRGYTLCEEQERIRRLLKLAEEGNLNTLRLWGEGIPFSDFLYDYADRHGLLLWQEFFCGHAQYPEQKEVRELILKEAELMVKSRKHHPSILLWCGGNECYLSRDFIDRKQEYLSADFFEYDLKALCSRLDPVRYYHVNSPFYGAYSNEPLAGDTHSYTNSWYVPGSKYPVFASENLRVSFPKEESLRKYLGTEKLPAPEIQKHGSLPWPVEYEQITSAESYKKIPPIEQFYDAETPKEMIYRFGMAAGLYIKDSVERYRRGRRPEENFRKRTCMGHFIWKWNTTFPHIYSSMIDAYLEPKMPYYFLKRAYEPVKVSIEVGDHIYIWGINDTKERLQGIITAKIFDMEKNQFTEETSFPAQILPGDSIAVGKLDIFEQMSRNKVIYAEWTDAEEKVLAQTHQFLDIERHITFPDAKLKIWQESGELCICSFQFARCVELQGEERGDSYWWDFSDNYFDLFPGVTKKVQITGKHLQGNISAKAFYSREAAVCIYKSQI